MNATWKPVDRTALGWVVDYCVGCRMPRAGALVEVREPGVTNGFLLGHDFECSACGKTVITNPASYARCASDSRMPLAELLAATNPRLESSLRAWRVA